LPSFFLEPLLNFFHVSYQAWHHRVVDIVEKGENTTLKAGKPSDVKKKQEVEV